MLKRSELLIAKKYRPPIAISRTFSAASGGGSHGDHGHGHHDTTTHQKAAAHDSLDSNVECHYGTNIPKGDHTPHTRYYVILGDPNPQTKIPVESVPPTPRGFVEWNGRKYPYPYRGIFQEENGPEVIKWAVKNQYVTKEGLLKISKVKRKHRFKLLQYWFQNDDGKPTYMKLAYDDYLFRILCLVLIYGFGSAVFISYKFITPKSQNMFLYENWKRWNKEHH